MLGLIETSELQVFRDPKKHISISILWGYPYLDGLHYKGVYMGYPYPNFAYVPFLGPKCANVRTACLLSYVPIRRVKVREQKLYAKLTLCFFSWLAYDIRHGFSWFAPETGYRFFRGPHMTLDIVLSRLHDIGYRFSPR